VLVPKLAVRQRSQLLAGLEVARASSRLKGRERGQPQLGEVVEPPQLGISRHRAGRRQAVNAQRLRQEQVERSERGLRCLRSPQRGARLQHRYDGQAVPAGVLGLVDARRPACLPCSSEASDQRLWMALQLDLPQHVPSTPAWLRLHEEAYWLVAPNLPQLVCRPRVEGAVVACSDI